MTPHLEHCLGVEPGNRDEHGHWIITHYQGVESWQSEARAPGSLTYPQACEYVIQKNITEGYSLELMARIIGAYDA